MSRPIDGAGRRSDGNAVAGPGAIVAMTGIVAVGGQIPVRIALIAVEVLAGPNKVSVLT